MHKTSAKVEFYIHISISISYIVPNLEYNVLSS